MRQTNVCLNRVFKKFYVKFVSRGFTQTFVLAKKVCDEIERKIKKTTGALCIHGDQGDESAIRNY